MKIVSSVVFSKANLCAEGRKIRRIVLKKVCPTQKRVKLGKRYFEKYLKYVPKDDQEQLRWLFIVWGEDAIAFEIDKTNGRERKVLRSIYNKVANILHHNYNLPNKQKVERLVKAVGNHEIYIKLR